MIHLYAFVQGLRSLPPRAGVGGEALEGRSLGGVTAVVGVVSAPVAQTPETAVAHGLVVEALLDHADSVLPVRFGPPFGDGSALLAATQARLPQLRESLLRVRGCVEVAVRIAPEETSAGRPPNGTSYLRELARRASGAAELHDSLRAYALDSRIEENGARRDAVRASYLVRRDDVAAFARHVDRLAVETPNAAVVCTGPWAPYSFVGEAA